MAGLLGLIDTANKSDSTVVHVFSRPNYPQLRSSRDLSQDNRVARWDRVTPDVWQDTLSLICDRYAAVRLEYTNALAYYISHKLPTYGNCPDPNGTKRAQKLADGPLLPATKTSVSSSWRCHKQDFEHIARLLLHASYLFCLGSYVDVDVDP